jgi:hypothetical protein
MRIRAIALNPPHESLRLPRGSDGFCAGSSVNGTMFMLEPHSGSDDATTRRRLQLRELLGVRLGAGEEIPELGDPIDLVADRERVRPERRIV